MYHSFLLPRDCTPTGALQHKLCFKLCFLETPLRQGHLRARILEWAVIPFSLPDCLPDPGIQPGSPSLQADSLPSKPPDLVIGHVYLHLLGKAILCSESCPERQKGQGFFTGAQGSGKVSLMSPQLELSFCPGAASKHSILHSAMGFVSWREWRQQRLMTEKH